MKNKLIKVGGIAMIVFAIVTFFQSCVVSALSSEPMNFNKETSQNGLLVGSITFPTEKPKFNGYFIGISGKDPVEKIARKNSTEIQISPEQIWKMKHKGQLDGGRTYLFAIERPAGNYVIPGIRLFTNSGIAALQRTSYSGGFSIPFDIKKGEITYVGNIIFNELANKNDTVVAFQNNYEKDINAIKNLQPSVDWDKAINDKNRKIEYKRED